MSQKLLTLILQESNRQGSDDQNLQFFVKYNTMLNEEDERLIQLKFRKILSQNFDLERNGTFQKELKSQIAQNDIMLKQQRALVRNNSHLWVTINPKPSVTLSEFKIFIEKIAKKTCLSTVLYVFEQRGTTANCDMGKGIHCHLLCQRNINYKPTKCITNIRNSCKKIVGDIKSQHLINIQVIGPEFASDKKLYILGENKYGTGADGVLKKIKQKADVLWRELNCINPYYGHIII